MSVWRSAAALGWGSVEGTRRLPFLNGRTRCICRTSRLRGSARCCWRSWRSRFSSSLRARPRRGTVRIVQRQRRCGSGPTRPAQDSGRQVTSAWGLEPRGRRRRRAKEFGNIRDGLKTVAAESAPDVIIGAHDWTGQLAADGSIVSLIPKKSVKSWFPKYALRRFPTAGASTALRRARERRARRQHRTRGRPEKLGASSRSRRSPSRRRARTTSRSPCRRHLPATRITCTRSSRALAATCSARRRTAR